MKNVALTCGIAVTCLCCLACSDSDLSLPTEQGWQISVDLGSAPIANPVFPVVLDMEVRVQKAWSGEPAPDGTSVVLHAENATFSNGLDTIEETLMNGVVAATLTFDEPGSYEILIDVGGEGTGMTVPIVLPSGG